ncbi:hypothetical protein [Shewanella xiamenensis]|uniref:hypothetical protein n=1 Tax=Shewanella xiamenensis TaxID=332186 RepID=UPI0004D9BED2|nr:hypothetical protein [Shewanella xiamenensis]KEK29109.1 hypothetical protein SXM_1265 [Shewanella xiamenensis]
MNKELSTQTTAATAPQFDLSNPQHLAMRKLMADVYLRHANALERGLEQLAIYYRGMGQGLERFAVYVLADPVLSSLSASLNFALFYMEELYRVRAAA